MFWCICWWWCPPHKWSVVKYAKKVLLSWLQLSCQVNRPNEVRWVQCVLIDQIEGSLMKCSYVAVNRCNGLLLLLVENIRCF